MKALYKPFGLLLSVLAGVLAGTLFKRAWRAVRHEDDSPDAKDLDRGWARSPPPPPFRAPSSAPAKPSPTAPELPPSPGQPESGPATPSRKPSERPTNRAGAPLFGVLPSRAG